MWWGSNNDRQPSISNLRAKKYFIESKPVFLSSVSWWPKRIETLLGRLVSRRARKCGIGSRTGTKLRSGHFWAKVRTWRTRAEWRLTRPCGSTELLAFWKIFKNVNNFMTHWHVSTVVYKWWNLADCKLLQFIKQQKIYLVNKRACVTNFFGRKQQMALVVCHSV